MTLHNAALLCLAPLLLTGPVAAACPPGAQTVLSCPMKGGARQLDVCIVGDNIRYSYGKPGRVPELTLTEPVATVAHQPWPGIGRNIWEHTTFTNSGHAYEVFQSFDKMVEQNAETGGVAVMRGDTEQARIECDPGRATLGLWAVSDAKQARGVCWQIEAQLWGSCQ
ncbi:MAG: hypothetical protein GY717_14655 [Rhodobacteraceae bacterium]|nr:hypothetical protein [Paracoccaceae bacterium]